MHSCLKCDYKCMLSFDFAAKYKSKQFYTTREVQQCNEVVWLTLI